MLNILIIEDDPMLRKGLAKKIGKLFPDGVRVIGETGSVREAIAFLKITSPDLVLADVELADGKSFDIFQAVDVTFDIIFLTAYNHYAIHAIKQGALDYLMKPLNDDELIAAIRKYQQNKNKGTATHEQLKVVTQEMEKTQANRIVLRTSNEYHIVLFENILYCESDGGYTTFYLKNENKIMVSKSIKEYEAILPKKQFLRTHQSYLVNISYVAKYDKDGFLILTESAYRIPVSTRKKDEVIATLFS